MHVSLLCRCQPGLISLCTFQTKAAFTLVAMAYGHLILPGTIMVKHPFLLHTPKIRARSPQWLTGVKTRVIRYLLGPTYTHAFLIRSRFKKGAKKGGERKEKQSTFTHHIIHIMGWVSGYSKLITGLRAAASGAFVC